MVEGGDDGEDEREADGDGKTPRERARRLATRLRFLRMRERTANFEDREAIRREIRRAEEELTRLADAGGFEVDVDVRRER
ncbi:hypothetical protein BRC93_03090 [Halobacteriales archaeon QS_5_70_15]|jgi:hypothetical protein|nr:MAG: hypothetical protein BRC93_03090 [Halobacteriales archaeon QS_5_70_15]